MTQPAHTIPHNATRGTSAAGVPTDGRSVGSSAAHRMFDRRAKETRQTAGQLLPPPASGPGRGRLGRLHRQSTAAAESVAS